MTALQPLLPRDWYSDDEWELATQGRCNHYLGDPGRVAYPQVPRCRKPSAPDSFYRWCTEHDQKARRDNPATYGR